MARAVFALLFCDARRVVTPGVVVADVVVARTVVVGRLDTVFVAVARDVRDDAFAVAPRVVAARVAFTRDTVVGVVAVRTVTLRDGVALLRVETLRDDVVPPVATARDADARPDVLRGLAVVGTTGCFATGTVGCCVSSATGSAISDSTGISSEYCISIS